MSVIISIASGKGGTGKTSVAVALATSLTGTGPTPGLRCGSPQRPYLHEAPLGK